MMERKKTEKFIDECLSRLILWKASLTRTHLLCTSIWYIAGKRRATCSYDFAREDTHRTIKKPRHKEDYLSNVSNWIYIIVIYLCIHGKCNPWDYVTMTRDVRLFKVWRACFLHHKSIGFTLARHKLSAHPHTHSLSYWLPLRIINNYISINCFNI